jgi:hypothetical protein
MSTKLKCIITGKTLLAAKEYYDKKLEKAGSEEALHSTYICKEAKDLLLKGFTAKQIKKQLKITEDLPEPSKEIIKQITTNEYGLNRNTMFTGLTSFTHQETDPDVLDFLNNIS